MISLRRRAKNGNFWNGDGTSEKNGIPWSGEEGLSALLQALH